MAEQIESEDAEDRIDIHALQPVRSAGDEACLVRHLGQQRGDGECQHQQREATRAQDDET